MFHFALFICDEDLHPKCGADLARTVPEFARRLRQQLDCKVYHLRESPAISLAYMALDLGTPAQIVVEMPQYPGPFFFLQNAYDCFDATTVFVTAYTDGALGEVFDDYQVVGCDVDTSALEDYATRVRASAWSDDLMDLNSLLTNSRQSNWRAR